jgi:hypothetical protein
MLRLAGGSNDGALLAGEQTKESLDLLRVLGEDLIDDIQDEVSYGKNIMDTLAKSTIETLKEQEQKRLDKTLNKEQTLKENLAGLRRKLDNAGSTSTAARFQGKIEECQAELDNLYSEEKEIRVRLDGGVAGMHILTQNRCLSNLSDRNSSNKAKFMD